MQRARLAQRQKEPRGHDEGATTWSFRTSESLNLEELLGALTVQVEILKGRLASEWDEDA